MSMEKTFASLLRHSRLATYDRRLNQVYVSPKQSKQLGDWGLKRTLPTVIRTPYVTIGDLDTVEHQTPWDSGHSQVAFLQRWKENFGNVPTDSGSTRQQEQQQQQQQHDYDNLASMTRSQFNHYIKHTITPETVHNLQQALQTNQITRDQVYNYLNISFRPEHVRVMGPIYSTRNLTPSSSSSNNNDNDIMVQGRILNAQKGGYAVGIGGIVALLPKRYAVGLKKPGDRFLVRPFYVRRAYIDDQGKPQVIVSLQPNPEITAPPPSNEHNNFNLQLAISSPTSSLPNNKQRSRRRRLTTTAPVTTTFDDLFATTMPSNSIDDLQLFLLGQDNIGRTKRISPSSYHPISSTSPTPSPPPPPPSSSTSTSSLLDQPSDQQQQKTKQELQQDHAIMMNRIITLLKNGTPNKQ